MMTKKTLAKAVTLSVLLMLPYGMAEAAEYTEQITGSTDSYVDKGIREENSTVYNFKDGDSVTVTSDSTGIDAISNENDENLEINGENLKFNVSGNYNGFDGIFNKNGNVTINGKSDFTVSSILKDNMATAYGIQQNGQGKTELVQGGNITVIATTEGVNGSHSSAYGVSMAQAGASGTSGKFIFGGGKISAQATNGHYTEGDAIRFEGYSDNAEVELKNNTTLEAIATSNDETIGNSKNDSYGINIMKTFRTPTGIVITGDNVTINTKSQVESGVPWVAIVNSYGIQMQGTNNKLDFNTLNIDTKTINYSEKNTGNAYGIYAKDKTTVKADNIDIQAYAAGNAADFNVKGVYGANGTNIELGNGYITAKSENGETNKVYAVEANGNNTIINIGDVEISTEITGAKDNDESIAIKAEKNAVINVGNVEITANASGSDVVDKVYGIWSTNGGNITINGTTTISTTGGQDIAVVAGTEGWNEESADFENPLGGTNNINLNYGAGSEITGDIISGYGGNITIGNAESGISTLSTRNNAGTLNLTGDALSANGGKLSINLTSGSMWTGRADDYQDADLASWADKHEAQFNPKFSHDIAASGDVSVNLAQGATWNVTGQSWISELDGNGVVDLTKAEGSDAVHIGKVSGNNTFIVNLKPGELGTSDMLYVADGTSKAQTLQINNREEVLSGMGEGDRIRFATVAKAGEGFNNVTDGTATFGRSTRIDDVGIFNVDFDVEYVDYDTDTEKDDDHAYNGGANFTDSEAKPGTDYVDSVYGSVDGAQNVYLVRNKVTEDNKSDAGKTIINMSKVNYNNAIYMDRLNKRVGEAKYLDDEENSGMWVRIRHDRIGKDDAFRSQNTMYEMGYDVKQDCGNGERRVGFAVDYMDGKAEYTGIAGDGDVKRYGLWLYDTWLGDKGHYTDYVLKWGHLENDFDIMARTTGEKITGDYSNNVFSASAEYGKKNDMGGGWYFEPQAQLQFARVTGADYVTSQDTKVSLDGINSLIGRAGFRLGRDLNENSTVYVKADLLHEFLGDQDITATDITGTLREEYENEGTWYDVGFGFATALGNNSYAFMDFEKSFGNDNDETYQINAGVQWTF